MAETNWTTILEGKQSVMAALAARQMMPVVNAAVVEDAVDEASD